MIPKQDVLYQQPLVTGNPQVLAQQSVQQPPVINKARSPSSSPSPDRKHGHIHNQPANLTAAQLMSNVPMASNLTTATQQVSMPQCCLNALQQHNPGFVPGTTGYTGDIPQHHHLYQ
jgi:hypothetical protein